MSVWSETTLGDLCKMYQPKTIGKKDMSADGAYPVYGANGIMGRYGSFNHESAQLVIGCRGACGTVHITEPKSWITGNSMVIQPDLKKADLQYLKYFFLGPADLETIVSGAAQPQITQSALKPVKVPLPPLEEQKRIVAVLDQAFAALERARAKTEANLADADELFERTANDLFRHDPEKSQATIGDVCEIQSGSGFPKKEQGQTSGQFPFYKVSDMNLKGNEWTLSRANNYIDDATRRRLGAAIFPSGSIVFPKVGGAIATNKKRVVEREGCVDNNVMGLLPKTKAILPEYLHEWLRSFDIYDFSNKAALPSITQKTVKNWPFAIPSKDEQASSVDKIRALRAAVRSLTASYSKHLNDIADLRQSILQKAFAGELT